MQKIAMITGATAGIGKATAELLSKEGFSLIITGRRKEKLEILKQKLINENKTNVLSLCFDIRNRKEVENAVKSLPDNWKEINILVNNAGLAAGLGSIDQGNYEDWEQMIDTNIKGLLYITREISPGMTERGNGHIINISSVAGKEVYENGNVYCATKHAVDALSKAMRIDLVEKGIKVTNIAPGAVETEFSLVRFNGDKQKADSVYKGFIPLCANDVAEAIIFAVTRPAHVNINDLLIMPAAQANTVKTVKK